MKIVPTTQMRQGETGVVADLQGGHGMIGRLESMGIIRGARVTKVGAQPLRGPVMLRAGRTQIAVGFGLAQRIMVEVQ